MSGCPTASASEKKPTAHAHRDARRRADREAREEALEARRQVDEELARARHVGELRAARPTATAGRATDTQPSAREQLPQHDEPDQREDPHRAVVAAGAGTRRDRRTMTRSTAISRAPSPRRPRAARPAPAT